MPQIHTYSPLILAVNWRSEICTDNQLRLAELQGVLASVNGITIHANDWPIGYGDLAHDNLPLFFQPTARITLDEACRETDVSEMALYIYDDCIAIAYIVFNHPAHLLPNDGQISRRSDELIALYASELCQTLFQAKSGKLFIAAKDYIVMKSLNQQHLKYGKLLWTARTAVGNTDWDVSSWLGENVSDANHLFIGSGNSWLKQAQQLSDFNRIMIFAQFHAAIFDLYENILNQSLKDFTRFSDKNMMKESDMQRHQTLIDHLDYININFSSACYGTQSIRREMLQQFQTSWQVAEQQQRIEKLADLVQQRLLRLKQDAIRQQNKFTQGLLGFLGALGLLGLVMDIKSFSHSFHSNQESTLLSLFADLSPDLLLFVTLSLVLVVSIIIYRNHE